MIVDNESSVLEKVKSCLEEDFNVVTVENNRKAFEMMDNDKENTFSLILIGTRIPNSRTPAFFSMKPGAKKNIDTSREEDFLKKSFTRQQLLDFVRRRID